MSYLIMEEFSTLCHLKALCCCHMVSQPRLDFVFRVWTIQSKFSYSFSVTANRNLMRLSICLPSFAKILHQIWESPLLKFQKVMQWGYVWLQLTFSWTQRLNTPYWTKNKANLSETNHLSKVSKIYLPINTILTHEEQEADHAKSNKLDYLQKQTAGSLFAVTSSIFQYKHPYYLYWVIINQNDSLTFHYLHLPSHHYLIFSFRSILFVLVCLDSSLLIFNQNDQFMILCQLLLLYQLITMKQDHQSISLGCCTIRLIFIL